MKRNGSLSAIHFHPLQPAPSAEIPGGTIMEEVRVPWLDEPIGTIVSRPSDQPPDSLSRGRIRTLWFFVPADPGSTIIKCDTVREALHLMIRDRFHGIFDLKNQPRGSQIASGDEDEIEALVLDWAGQFDAWNGADLSADHSVIRDVLRVCPSAIIRKQAREGGGPGLSGTWYSVRARNKEQLRTEIAEVVQSLVQKQPPPTVLRSR